MYKVTPPEYHPLQLEEQLLPRKGRPSWPTPTGTSLCAAEQVKEIGDLYNIYPT